MSIFFFQDRGLDFGLTVLPCSTPPGVKIFGSAPQFNAKNFSHVFVHGSDYEIPGKTDFCYILRKEKKYECNRSRMIVKILEVWIASKIRLRPGRDVGMNALVFGYFL